MYREKAYYLIDTVDSLVKNSSPEEQKEIVIVVFVADFSQSYREKVIADIQTKFPNELQVGLIQVIVSPNTFYPNMLNLPLLYGDSPERVQWRSKQNLDYSFLYYHCADLGEYYVQIEDDVTTEQNYLGKIKMFIGSRHGNWSILEFGARGFIGMMYRGKHLPSLARFIRFYFWTMPVDWLFRVYNEIYLFGNHKNNILKPPIFRHVGKVSSLHGQIRKLGDLEDRYENEMKSVIRRSYQSKEGNPPASLHTTIKEYVVPKSIDNPYGKESYFWGKNLKLGDSINIAFKTPVKVSRVVINSGSPKYRLDSLENTELFFSFDETCNTYTSVKNFTGSSLIDYATDKNIIKPSKCIKLTVRSIRVDSQRHKRWLIINEIAIL